MTHSLRFSLMAAGLTLAHAASAGTLTPLYSFAGGSDGVYPMGPIAIDEAGNIFGTTQTGGSGSGGTLFELSPPARGKGPWVETILWNFDNKKEGFAPEGLVQDSHGNLFGSLVQGGANNCGSMFELEKTAAGWKPEIIWHFSSGDACQAFAPPLIGPTGTLYGTTIYGGTAGDGTVFSLVPPAKGGTNWSEAILYSFNPTVGDRPNSQLIMDSAGNLYGEASDDGANGGGAVWELMPPQSGATTWSLTDLWSPTQSCGVDGNGALSFAPAGGLYGICRPLQGTNFGAVFALLPPEAGQMAWTAETLFSFNVKDGNPAYGVVQDKRGNLYGVTQDVNGTVYELTPPAAGQTTWNRHGLWRFTGGADGSDPTLPLVVSAGRTITGTSREGGATFNGTVWRWTP